MSAYDRRGVAVLVNSATEGSQTAGRAAAFQNGGFVVVWLDQVNAQNGGPSQLKAQRFGAAGEKLGGEILIGSFTANAVVAPSVTTFADGRFVVSWSKTAAPGDAAGDGVAGQMFAADGSKSGDEFLANATTTTHQRGPVSATLSDGSFVIAWTDLSGDGSGTAVRAQRFDTHGAKLDGEFLVNTTILGGQSAPAIAALPGGGFAISFTDGSATAPDTFALSVRVQVFDGAGAKVQETLVNSVYPGSQTGAKLASLADGGFVVAWADLSQVDDRSGNGVKAQRFDAAGNKVGSEILVNTATAGDQFLPAVRGLADGGFLVSWLTGPSSALDLKAQVFSASGQKVGVEFTLSVETIGQQSGVDLIALASGDIAAIYTDGSQTGGDTSGTAVVAQLLGVATSPPTALALSTATVSEIAIENFAVATLNATGAVSSTFTYEMVKDATGGAFAVDGDRLVVIDNSRLDFETRPSVQLTLRATDLNGNFSDHVVTVNIGDEPREARYAAVGPTRVSAEAPSSGSGALVTALPSGGALVTWSDRQINTLLGRRYDDAGEPLGAAFQVSSNIAGPSHQVGVLDSGNLVVVWRDATSGRMRLSGQLLTADGATIGQRFEVAADGIPSGPEVVELAGGGFMVAWTGRGQDSYDDIIGQLFDANGSKVGSEVRVNSSTALQQDTSQLIALADGSVLAVWRSEPAGGLLGQRFTSAGVPSGGELTFVSGRTELRNGSAADLAGGGFVLTWEESVVAQNGLLLTAIRAQVFDPAGAAKGAEILAGLIHDDAPAMPKVSGLPNGGFVLNWRSPVSNDASQIVAQLHDAGGATVGQAFVVSPPAAAGGPLVNHVGTTVAGLTSGALLFGWQAITPSVDANGFTDYHSQITARAITPADEFAIGTGDPDMLTGGVGNDRHRGLAGDDWFRLEQGGDDIAEGNDGNDGFYFGAAFTGGDRIDGGAGSLDQVGLHGTYSGLVLGGYSLQDVEFLVLLSGTDIRFGGAGDESFDYHVTMNDANVASGQQFVVSFNTLKAGEDVTFNGAAEQDGSFLTYAGQGVDILTGGQRDDGFFFGADGRFGTGDRIHGQGGAFDTFGLQGNYAGANKLVLAADALTAIKLIALLSAGDSRFGGGAANGYSYDITLNDGNVAAGQVLNISANTLKNNGGLTETLRLDGSAELDGRLTVFAGDGADVITGGRGADQFFGRGGNDRFVYTDAQQSTDAARDQIRDFNAGDKIDLSALDAIAGGGDDAFTFIDAAAAFTAAGQLRVTGGAGSWLIEAEMTGDGVADLVIAVTTIDPAYQLGLGDFVP